MIRPTSFNIKSFKKIYTLQTGHHFESLNTCSTNNVYIYIFYDDRELLVCPPKNVKRKTLSFGTKPHKSKSLIIYNTVDICSSPPHSTYRKWTYASNPHANHHLCINSVPSSFAWETCSFASMTGQGFVEFAKIWKVFNKTLTHIWHSMKSRES